MDKITKNQDTDQCLINLFPTNNKRTELSYTGRDISSDGGLLLLKEVENQIGLIDKLHNCIHDERDQRYVRHKLKQLLLQRVYLIASALCEYSHNADAILDRLVHSSYRIELEGESMRKKYKNNE